YCAGAGEAEAVSARLVSGEFFSVLGVNPALGRNFRPDEDQPGAGPVVIISAALWQRKFAEAPDAVGKSLRLDDKSYTIIGVLPADFALLRTSDVFALIGQWNGPPLRSRMAGLGLHGVGRIKPGVTFAQAQADLDKVMRNLAALYPEANRGNGAKLVPLKEQVVGNVRLTLLLLLGAVGCVLLIACVNVSNLLLARSTSRTREFAIRAALGAGQWRLLRQLLTESTLLALAGGALGLMLAAWGTQAALGALPTALPRAHEVGLDVRVLLFTLAISLGAGALAGLAPALKVSQWRLSETLKEGGRGGGVPRRAQGVLVAVEMALALVLLIGAGLMIRTLNALWNVNPGFNADNVTVFDLTLPTWMRDSTPQIVRASLRDLNEKMKTTPGVESVSFSADALPMYSENDLFFYIEGQPKPASTSEMPMTLIYTVDTDYLNVMRIPLKQGRFFNANDDERGPAVAVIDEAFAKKHFRDKDPIGARIFINDQNPFQIIRVVGHVKQWGLETDDKQSLQAQLYVPFRGLPDDNLPVRSVGVVV